MKILQPNLLMYILVLEKLNIKYEVNSEGKHESF